MAQDWQVDPLQDQGNGFTIDPGKVHQPGFNPQPLDQGDGDAESLPTDQVGDIPPPPVPAAPIEGVGVAGIPGTEGSTFARPGSKGAVPFRTAAFQSPHPPRFGPGVPFAGSATTDVSGLGDTGLDPERAAELLRALASGYNTGT